MSIGYVLYCICVTRLKDYVNRCIFLVNVNPFKNNKNQSTQLPALTLHVDRLWSFQHISHNCENIALIQF